MKKASFYALSFPVIVTLLLCPMNALALKASTTGYAVAQVVSTVSVLARTPLIFGYIWPNSSAGTVTVTTRNTRTSSGKVNLVPGAFSRAIFVIKGQPNRSYTMQAPSSLTFKATGTSPILSKGKITELTARDFVTYSENSRQDTSTSHLSRAGIDIVYLGGTLVVPNNVAPGLYMGLVPLTVYY